MSGCVVLLFHSVDDRNLLSLRDLGNVRPEVFEKTLRYLRREFDVVGLRESLAFSRGTGKSGGRPVAVTFDDGPKSYARKAFPIMEAMGIPSTCFLITDCVGDRKIYWRYLYNFCIQSGHGRALASMVSSEYGRHIEGEEIISFTRGTFDRKKNRRIVEKIADRLISREEYRQREGELFLSEGDIEILKRSPLVSFGIHTKTHPVMAALGEEEIIEEIGESVGLYRKVVKDEKPMFSVPFGRLYRDYDERTVLVAKKLGVEIVCSAYGGANEPGHPLYNVRRIPVSEGMLTEGMSSFKRLLRNAVIAPEYAEGEIRLCEALGRRHNEGVGSSSLDKKTAL